MSGYCVKLGVYTGVISLLVHGFYRISNSVIHASVDVLNIYYPEIVRKYGDTILNNSGRYLKFILGFIWISGILRISEIYEIISASIVKLFTNKVNIGSLSFSLGKLVLFIGVLYFTFLLARFTKRIFEREILARHKMKRGMAASISLTIRIFIVFFGTLIALSLSGLDFSKIGIIAGALSVGIGFGLQNIVNNFISGLILVYEKPVQEGDTIEVDTLLGRVSNIGTRSSTITTYDGAEVVVPNSNLISNQLINWTLSDNRKRVEIKVGTSYNSNPHQVLQLLSEAALSNERVLRDPEPRPLFLGFGDNSLNFRLLFWVHFEEGLATQSDVALKIFDILKENNIEIPFPQLDLHIKHANVDTSKNEAP
jgi:small-conductance mechanosensitive channel